MISDIINEFLSFSTPVNDGFAKTVVVFIILIFYDMVFRSFNSFNTEDFFHSLHADCEPFHNILERFSIRVKRTALNLIICLPDGASK